MLTENKIPKFKTLKILPKSKTLLSETATTHPYKVCLNKCKVQINIKICMINYFSYLGRGLAACHSSDSYAWGQLACVEFIWNLSPDSRREEQSGELGWGGASSKIGKVGNPAIR